MLNDLFRGLMSATPVTPELDTSGSQGLNDQALALLAQAGSMPQVAAPKAPNLESIGLALLPALFGAGTNYLGGLGSGYMRGQQQEIARQNQNRTETMNNLIRQAQTLGGQADDMRQVELAQFNQGNMNARNNMDNFRSTMNTLANNQTRKDIATDKNALTQQGMADKMFKDAVKSAAGAIRMFTESYGYDQNANALRDKAVAQLKAQFPDKAALIDSMVPAFPIGFKPKAVKDAETRKASQVAQLRSLASGAWGKYLGQFARTGIVTEGDVKVAEEYRRDFAETWGIDERMLPLPQPGKTWQMTVAENNANLRKAEFEFDKAKRREDLDLERQQRLDKRLTEIRDKALKTLDDKYEKVVKDAENVNERILELQKEQDKADNQDTVDKLQKQIDTMRVMLSATGEIGKKLAEKDAEQKKIMDKYTVSSPDLGVFTPEVPPGLPDVRNDSGIKGSIGFGSQNEGGKSAPKKPKAAQGKQPAKPPVKQAPKPKNDQKPVQGPPSPKATTTNQGAFRRIK